MRARRACVACKTRGPATIRASPNKINKLPRRASRHGRSYAPAQQAWSDVLDGINLNKCSSYLRRMFTFETAVFTKKHA